MAGTSESEMVAFTSIASPDFVPLSEYAGRPSLPSSSNASKCPPTVDTVAVPSRLAQELMPELRLFQCQTGEDAITDVAIKIIMNGSTKVRIGRILALLAAYLRTCR